MKHFNFKHLKGEIETCWMERKSNLAYTIFDALKKQDQKKLVFQTCCQTQYQWDNWISSMHGLNEKPLSQRIHTAQ